MKSLLLPWQQEASASLAFTPHHASRREASLFRGRSQHRRRLTLAPFHNATDYENTVHPTKHTPQPRTTSLIAAPSSEGLLQHPLGRAADFTACRNSVNTGAFDTCVSAPRPSILQHPLVRCENQPRCRTLQSPLQEHVNVVNSCLAAGAGAHMLMYMCQCRPGGGPGSRTWGRSPRGLLSQADAGLSTTDCMPTSLRSLSTVAAACSTTIIRRELSLAC